MGRLFLIELDGTPDVRFYLCRTCQTHIALASEFIFEDIAKQRSIFQNVVNMLVDGPAHHRKDCGGNTVTGASCTKCNRPLGWKYVKVEGNSMVVREGRYLLYLTKLLLWNGNQLVDAATLQPPQNM